jgi:hypothetical protein
VFIWYIFARFGMFYREKSGNPGRITRELENKTTEDAHTQIQYPGRSVLKYNEPLTQGCQICLGPNVPKRENVPNDDKLYQTP